MNNTIKYNSTGSENNALNKDNWWIGTGDVSKHPTSSTGFWRTITPNGYAVYSPKPNGEPSIHMLSTDSELINFTNRFYNKSFTTVEECLEYYANEPDLLCQTDDFESIITDGLVLYLDVNHISSYPKIGSKWFDLSNHSNNADIFNNPNLNNNYFRFNGNDDQAEVNSSTELNFQGYSVTVSAWVRERNNAFDSTYWNTVSKYNQFILGPNGTPEVAFLVNTTQNGWDPGNYNNSGVWSNIYDQSNFDYSLFHYYTGVYDQDNGKSKVYIDDTLVAEHSVGTQLSSDSGVIKIAKRDANGNYLNADIGLVQIYNRALSYSEIKQNYDATKHRFS